MTKIIIKEKKRKKYRADFVNIIVNMSIILILILLVIYLSATLARSVSEGLNFVYNTIIPVVFPYMIISDILLTCLHVEKISFIRRLFEKLFHINGYAINAFLIGALCGFPMGVKTACDLYKKGIITRDECERLIGFSNYASPAFVIYGIGFTMFNSASVGIILYIIPLFSSLFTAIVFSQKKKESSPLYNTDLHFKFSFSDSVKSAVFNTLTVCGFIIVFSMILGLIKTFIKKPYIIILLAPFLEIGNAAKIISESMLLTENSAFLLMLFAISFSGFSVHFQSKSQLFGTDISMRKYYEMKFISALISILFGILYMTFFLLPL